MKKRSILVPLSLAAALAPTASCRCSDDGAERRTDAAARPTETLADQSFRLQNGLQVELVAGPCSDSASLVVLVNVGIDHDPPGRSGLAHLAERVLSSVAKGQTAPVVETGRDYTVYSVVVDGDRLLDELNEVAARMSRKPTEADLERSRAQVLGNLSKLQGADAALTAMSYAEEAVQPTRGNGKRRGIASEVEAITLAELQAFWQAHFKPGNARIVVAGRFDTKKAHARIETAFAPLPTGTPPIARKAANGTVKGTLVIGDAPTAIAMAVPAPAMSSPLYPPFLVLATRLIIESSQAGSWKASYDPIKRPELLFVTSPVGKTERPEPAAARLRSQVTTILVRPLTPDDIEGAQKLFRLLLEPKLLDPAVCAKHPRAFAIARARRAQLEAAPLTRALDKINNKQLEEASKLFDPKRIAVVIAGGSIH
jgi:zinc protease